MEKRKKPAIVKTTIREQVVEVLRKKIFSGEIKPGERIVEADVSEMLQVSRGPIREALRQIEEEGLITYEAHKGCVVRLLSHRDMQELYLIRSTLEGLAVKIYSARMSTAGINKLQKAVDDIAEAAEKKSLFDIVEADERFHDAMVEEAGCEKLYQMWKSLGGANAATYYTMNTEELMPYDYLAINHQYILDLLKKDAGVDKVVEAVSEHYMVVPETLYIKEQSQSN
ncbi:GntR family transcriptional regulator [Bariatricus massiliensis]|uniref:GntR family transcriptional regulator n=1 Tax=Bariatricus massiliensis TaxID=1745713 RepID=A0ABS8DG61_9FIRM|nr:GntR family transcriptional regulator [Bariatricus massiliensis]MCB7304293.1 GntR family transcriptional regulator [Bariatricus massiliensis]MCB7374944.1 GntR family transcriptional regulator [Bariatricus massiliensis]MCB7387403.1 GntR family transcriptional regulator [Bariatricus massiliensis]MCB7411565.1 GntR family transcriptional regulator [Bariatricus massiliensis]MCQ5253700.1 GntR family transcriptional regulator [Bariatricus massiliensis]